MSFLHQPQLASLCATSSRGRPTTAHKPPAQQPEGLQGESKVDQTHPGPVVEEGSRSSTESPSLGSTGDAGWSFAAVLKYENKDINF